MNSADTKADALKNEPIIIRKIRRDYDRIQTLAEEKVQIAEEALRLVSLSKTIPWVCVLQLIIVIVCSLNDIYGD
jgi:hypothetical protein